MSIANRLYDRPHGSNLSPVNEAALYVDGSFPSAAANLAYIGRLQIHNAIGACKVKLLSSDPALPKGYTLGVDNTTHEVVLKWPAYQSGTVAIPNANFELGDDGSWDLGPGWSIMSGVTAPDPNDAGSSWQAQYANQGGNSLLIHRMAADVSPGQSITCSCDVQQGASSSASAGAAVRLRFTDDAGTIIQEFDGAAVMSGSNSEWHTSSLSADVPGGATKVHIGADAVRNRENKPLWVDNFQWNLTQEALGTNEAHTITLSLRVTDTSGRTADWTGSIDVGTGADVIANLDFNTSLTADSTGRAWTVEQGTNGGSGITYPVLSSSGAKEGTALQAAESGTHWSQSNHGCIYSAIGGDGIPANTDFCAEGFASLWGTGDDFNATTSFFGIHTDKPWSLGAVSGHSHTPDYYPYYYFSPLTAFAGMVDHGVDTRFIPGTIYHWAMTRNGDVLNLWWNGQLAYSGAGFAGAHFDATANLYLGHHLTGVSLDAWPFSGALDDFRFTLGWARYTAPFTPPTPPYPPGA